jgi:hypothetical protein
MSENGDSRVPAVAGGGGAGSPTIAESLGSRSSSESGSR